MPSYFYPDGQLWILQNTGLTSTHNDTFDFLSSSAQYTFFRQKVKYSLTTVAPVRIGQTISVPYNANDLYNCDYIMFQNKNFSNKIFYAFITDIEWQSLESAIIHYEIDDIQTWLFEAQLTNCYIERCHAEDDTVGINLVPENLELGEYTIFEETPSGLFDEYLYCAAATVDNVGASAPGALYNGIYSGLRINFFETPQEINNFLTKMTQMNKVSGVISVFMFPKEFRGQAGQTTAEWQPFSVHKRQTGTLDGYLPKNNKLYTYPYNFLMVSNNSGTVAEYRYEDFNTPAECPFKIYVDLSPNPTAICVPDSYNKRTAGSQPSENWNEKITMDGFPQCAWSNDAYKAWLAQNGSSTVIGNMSSAFGAAASLFTGNAVGAISQGFSIAQSVAQVKATQALPPQAHGPTAGNALVANRKKDFIFYAMTLKKEFATIIDEYFTMFGYATHKVGPILKRTRKSFNYIETKECYVKGNLPSEAARHIESIYNKGIRFWHGDYIGDYFRDNGTLYNRGEGETSEP